MKKTFQLKAIYAFVIALFATTALFAQNAPKPKPATNESVQGKIGNANVTITYGSPSLQGRKILGQIEPYGKPWRAGGNASTTITTDQDLTVEGQKLPAGKYSIFMVPDEKEWKVMFNSQTGQWGIKQDKSDGRGYSANVDPSKNVVVVTVKPKKAGPTEKLKYEIRPNGIALVWEDVEIPVSIK
jgi:hypothetical protein